MKKSFDELQLNSKQLDRDKLTQVKGGTHPTSWGAVVGWGVGIVTGWFDDSDEYIPIPCEE